MREVNTGTVQRRTTACDESNIVTTGLLADSRSIRRRELLLLAPLELWIPPRRHHVPVLPGDQRLHFTDECLAPSTLSAILVELELLGEHSGEGSELKEVEP